MDVYLIPERSINVNVLFTQFLVTIHLILRILIPYSPTDPQQLHTDSMQIISIGENLTLIKILGIALKNRLCIYREVKKRSKNTV